MQTEGRHSSRARLTWPCSLPPNQSRRNYACYTLYKRILGVFSPPSSLLTHSLGNGLPCKHFPSHIPSPHLGECALQSKEREEGRGLGSKGNLK